MTGPVVIKLGGTGVESPLETPTLWREIIALHRERRAAHGPSSGVVLVHGGGKAADELLARLGYQTTRINGLRVTPPEQLDHIAAVLAGRVNKAIVAALAAHGQHAVGLCPGECGTANVRQLRATAFPVPRATAFPVCGDSRAESQPTSDSPDLGLVGEITGGNPAFIQFLLAADVIPVFSPIAINTEANQAGVPPPPGRASCSHPFLNINADDVAASLAAVVHARTLVLLTDTPGVRGPTNTTIPLATPDDIEHLIATGVIHGGMVPKVRAALRAADLARCDTVIASWQHPETLRAVCEGLPTATATRIASHTPQASKAAH